MSQTFEWCIDKTRLETYGKQLFFVHRNGNKYWCFNGKYHRVNGPAIERANGTKWWVLNGNLHRVNGPAVEYANGTKEWWLNGKEYSESAYWKEMNK